MAGFERVSSIRLLAQGFVTAVLYSPLHIASKHAHHSCGVISFVVFGASFREASLTSSSKIILSRTAFHLVWRLRALGSRRLPNEPEA